MPASLLISSASFARPAAAGQRSPTSRSSGLAPLPARPLHRAPISRTVRRGGRLVVSASDKGPADYAKQALEVGNKAVDAGVNLVPESVPRPVAKGGVAVVGILIVTSVAKSLLSTALTLAVLGGAGYWFFFSDGGSGGGGMGGGGSGGGSKDEGDALDDARRIMDKYK